MRVDVFFLFYNFKLIHIHIHNKFTIKKATQRYCIGKPVFQFKIFDKKIIMNWYEWWKRRRRPRWCCWVCEQNNHNNCIFLNYIFFMFKFHNTSPQPTVVASRTQDSHNITSSWGLLKGEWNFFWFVLLFLFLFLSFKNVVNLFMELMRKHKIF